MSHSIDQYNIKIIKSLYHVYILKCIKPRTYMSQEKYKLMEMK